MIRKLLTLLAPIMLVLMLEALFEAGVWEPLAQPASHAGTSVRLKRALTDPAIPRIDYVTLGSSRPEYGIDHALLAATSQRHGRVHADLTMPGSHWMTLGILARWLQREHPEIQGGIIALSIHDFMYAGNGDYETGIVYPFRRSADIPWMAAHVPFQRDDIASFGTYSALFGWRSDIQEFVRNPSARMATIDWYKTNRSSVSSLFENPESHGDMCAFGIDALTACDKVEASTDPDRDGLKRQCKELRGSATNRPDLGSLMRQQPLPQFMQKTRDLVQAQLRAMRWPKPPLIVLMPVPRIWTHDVLGAGLHEWALAILQPLAAEGRIRLIDASDSFDADGDAECGMFFDFYHQNAVGRDRLTRWLLPQVESLLYQDAGVGPAHPSTEHAVP